MKVAIFNDTRTKIKHFGCETVMGNLERLLSQTKLKPVWYWPVGQDWRTQTEKLPSRGEIDAVIVNGEGSIHNSATRDRPYILADVAKMASEKLGVPAFLINATLHQNSSQIYERLKHFKAIYVRDSASLTELENYGLSGKFVPDLTLSYPDTTLSLNRKGVGATDSIITSISLDIKKVCRHRNYEFCPMAIETPEYLSIKDIRHPLGILLGRLTEFLPKNI